MSFYQAKEIQMGNFCCDVATHSGKIIEALCLNPQCSESPSLCSKCGFKNHPQCRGQIEELETIPKLLMGLRYLQLDILVLQEQINQQFKELLSKIEQILLPINKYIAQPTLFNLKEIGFLLRKQVKQLIIQSIDESKTRIKSFLDNNIPNQQINQVRQIQISKLQPKQNAQSWFQKGVQLHVVGNYDKAIKCFDEAIKVDPSHFKSWFQKGDSLRFLGKYSEAIDCLDQAIKIDPNHLESWLSKGNSLEQLGRLEECIKCYEQCYKIEPKSVELDLKRVRENFKTPEK